jgi:3-phosphoglycerate kinase
MTIQQVIANEKEINELVLAGKMLEAFIKFYGENVGKVACQAYEEGFMSSITQFNEAKLLSSVVMPSDDSNYEFLVIATWYNDIVTTNYPIKGNQSSLCYWKDGMIQKVTFKSGSEIIA